MDKRTVTVATLIENPTPEQLGKIKEHGLVFVQKDVKTIIVFWGGNAPMSVVNDIYNYQKPRFFIAAEEFNSQNGEVQRVFSQSGSKLPANCLNIGVSWTGYLVCPSLSVVKVNRPQRVVVITRYDLFNKLFEVSLEEEEMFDGSYDSMPKDENYTCQEEIDTVMKKGT